MIPGNQSVTVIRGGINGRTNAWQETSRHVIDGCLFAPASTTEQTGTGDVVQVDAAVFAPYGSDVTATDRVILGSYPATGSGSDQQVYDVVGDPFNWQSPITGERKGCEVRLVEHR